MVGKALARVVGAILTLPMVGEAAELLKMFTPYLEAVCAPMAPNPHDKVLRLARTHTRKVSA